MKESNKINSLREIGLHLSVIAGGQSSWSAVTHWESREKGNSEARLDPYKSLQLQGPGASTGKRRRVWCCRSVLIGGQEERSRAPGHGSCRSSRWNPHFARAQGFTRGFFPPAKLKPNEHTVRCLKETLREAEGV